MSRGLGIAARQPAFGFLRHLKRGWAALRFCGHTQIALYDLSNPA